MPKMGVESGRKSAIGRRKDASTYAWLTHWSNVLYLTEFLKESLLSYLFCIAVRKKLNLLTVIGVELSFCCTSLHLLC